MLVRLGMLHLIRMKVKQAALRPEQSFCISPALPDGKARAALLCSTAAWPQMCMCKLPTHLSAHELASRPLRNAMDRAAE